MDGLIRKDALLVSFWLIILNELFLSFVDTSNISKTANKVFEMLDAIVERIGEANVVQVITDNAANYKAAGHLLMEKRKNLYWTPCTAHCIDLILKDFEKKLEVHEVTIGKGRRIIMCIYSRTILIFMLRHFKKRKEILLCLLSLDLSLHI